ncbi:hypothetical protein BG011_001322 [Mortierella polycephala]|uniref:Adhesin domain-containing protein n=1 Tax=Mortierella polycephala TaxID=41804 RepID=A0A9P6PLH0_9FUNG|nr:hypothetical protein BG011_001322 [Mortierella polycephala]
MANFSSLHSLSLVFIALIFASLFATSTIDAAPATKQPKAPVFTVYSKSNLAGKSETLSKYGCQELNIGTVGSVKYQSGPTVNLKFYELKGCKGKITHQMPSMTYKQMGGPFKTQSVMTFTNNSCNIPQNYEAREVNYAIAASPDLVLAFETLDGIVGDMVVKESESMDNQNVHIRIVMSATSDTILNQMEGGIHEDELNIRSWVHLKDSNSNEQKRKLLFGNCARADVEIIYPRVRPGTKSLKVKTTVGDLSVRMDPKRSEPIFESIAMEVVSGVIDFKHVIVSKKTSLKVINGQIRGSLRTAGTLSTETVNAPVDLAVDTTPLAPDWNPLDDFQADISTINGPATLKLANPFYGKFSLGASVGRPTITLPYNTKDVVKYDTNKWNELEGWISKDGTKNALGHAQVDIQTVNGVIRLGIQE